MIRSENEQVRQVTRELSQRRIAALKLYEPIHDEQAGFHNSRAPQLMAIGANRGGKTLTAAIEVARFASNDDPIKPDTNTHVGTEEIEVSRTTGEGYLNRRIMVVGRDLEHVGTVLWRKLGRAGAFRIIRDRQTGLWRTVRPTDPDDCDRLKEAKPAPPLIPPSKIASISWENKAQGIPNCVTLTNGTELRFYSGKAEPPQGQDVDLVWMDEEIRNDQWYPEMLARLLDRKGRLIWSATPENATEALFELSERAEEERKKTKPTVESFFFHIEQNPHIGKTEREQFYRSLSPEQRRVKYHGQFKITGYRMFPEFDIEIHGYEWDNLPDKQIPREWARFMAVDPGYGTCAALFGAVTKDNLYVYLYDEIYLHNCTAARFAEELAHKVTGQNFAAFVIDYQYGKQTHTSTGKTVEAHYSEELKAKGISSWLTGHGFIWGSSDVKGGIEAIRRWLMIRGDGPGCGTAKLRVMKGNMPHFEYEMRKYNRKVQGGVLLDEPNNRGPSHLVDCLRYLSMYNPRWQEPPASTQKKADVWQWLEKKRQRNGPPDKAIRLGPGATY